MFLTLFNLPPSFPSNMMSLLSFLWCPFFSSILYQSMPSCVNSAVCVFVCRPLQCVTTVALETCTPTGYLKASLGRMRFVSLLQSWAVRWVSASHTFNIKRSAHAHKTGFKTLFLSFCLLFVISRIPAWLRDHAQRCKGMIFLICDVFILYLWFFMIIIDLYFSDGEHSFKWSRYC